MFCVAAHKATWRTQFIPSFTCGSRRMNTLVSHVLPPSLVLAGSCNGCDLCAGSPSLSHCFLLVVGTGVLGTCLGMYTAGGRKWKAAEAGWREKCVCKRESLNQLLEGNQKGRQISWTRQGCGSEGKERLQRLQVLPQKVPFARECFAVSLPILTFSWVFNCPIKT